MKNKVGRIIVFALMVVIALVVIATNFLPPVVSAQDQQDKLYLIDIPEEIVDLAEQNYLSVYTDATLAIKRDELENLLISGSAFVVLEEFDEVVDNTLYPAHISRAFVQNEAGAWHELEFGGGYVVASVLVDDDWTWLIWNNGVDVPPDVANLFNNVVTTSTPIPTNTPAPTYTPSPTQTLISTAIPATATPQPAPQALDTLTPPPANPNDLPQGLMGPIVYVAPPEECWVANDIELPCSTEEGQSTVGTFTLDALEARVITGDQIYLGVGETEIYPRLESQTGIATDVVVLANNSAEPIDVDMVAPYGSFRGDFELPIFEQAWQPEWIANLRDLHLNYMTVQSDPAAQAWIEALDADEDMPYPTLNPANCSTVANLAQSEITYCDYVNVYVAVWDGQAWEIVSYGAYSPVHGWIPINLP